MLFAAYDWAGLASHVLVFALAVLALKRFYENIWILLCSLMWTKYQEIARREQGSINRFILDVANGKHSLINLSLYLW